VHFSVPGAKTEVELTLRDRLIGKPRLWASFRLAPLRMKIVELH